MLPSVDHVFESTNLPAILPPVVAPRRRAFYLVGETERSTPRPAAIDGRTMISINGRWSALRGPSVSYAQLLHIAYPDRERGFLTSATVSYRSPGTEGPSGLLTPGDTVPLADGLLFNVAATYAS